MTLEKHLFLIVVLRIYYTKVLFNLIDYLYKKNIPATFISQTGNHNSNYWHFSIEHHFVYFQQHLK